jgi:DNA-binding transcriptional LysR family regulator
MTIDLRLVKYLVTTADEGSANRAAAALHVTQPVLSRQLRQLEAQTGLRLFDRSGRRLHLTHVGEEFLERARRVLRDAELLDEAARSLAAGKVEQLHIAVPTTTLTDVLAPFLATLRSDDPVPLLRSLDPRGASAAIAAGADLAIVHRPPPQSLASRRLAVLPLLAYVPPSDPWAHRQRIDLTDLLQRPLVLMTEEYRPRTLLDGAVDAAGLAYGHVLECTNAQVAQAMAAAGRGVAVVSDDPRFDLVPLSIDAPTGPLHIRLYASWHPLHHAAETLADISERLSAFCVERYGSGVRPDDA